MNTPDGNTVSTAQLTMSLLTSLARHIPAANMSVKEGLWDRKSFTGVELNGKTLGIIGCGRIGQVVAHCARSMGMRVIGYDPVMSPAAVEAAGIVRVDKLDHIWRDSDFITVHTPLTPETCNILNDETLAKCKAGVRVINCARGGIIDEQALLRALESGHVAGAALDVYTSEPPKEHLNALLRHPRVVCTPHLGASTDEAQVNVARDIARQMCDVFDQKDFVGICNVSYIAAAALPNIKPFMKLAELLGGMLSQLSDSPIEQVEISTWGGRDVSITTAQTRKLLEAQLLKGLVQHRPAPGGGSAQQLVPDLVSAPAMAQALGIRSSVRPNPPAAAKRESQYWNLVQVDAVRADGSTSSISGVVLGDQPHIVQVDDFCESLSFRPEGQQVLTFRNPDRPGTMLQVLDALAGAGINVASLCCARIPAQARALVFMDLDESVPTNVLKTLRADPALSHVACIRF